MRTRTDTAWRKKRRRGSYFVEFSLSFWPLFVLMLGIIDFSMPIFLRSAFTNAAREGVRYATTYRTLPGMNHIQSIQSIVVQNSTGFLDASTGANYVVVKFYDRDSGAEVVNGLKNNDRNIVEVSIVNYTWNWIVPLWGPHNPLVYNIVSADRLETLPLGVARPAAP